MTEHRDEEMTTDTAELLGDRRRPARMIVEVEFSPDDIQRLKRGIGRGAPVTQFVRQAALAEADRRAAERKVGADTERGAGGSVAVH